MFSTLNLPHFSRENRESWYGYITQDLVQSRHVTVNNACRTNMIRTRRATGDYWYMNDLQGWQVTHLIPEGNTRSHLGQWRRSVTGDAALVVALDKP